MAAGRGDAFRPFRRAPGKASVVNDLVAQARGDVVVLTDANTFFEPGAVRALVTALWRHPTACAVVGCLELRSSAAGGNLDGTYWRYETWLKTLESHFGAVLGPTGPSTPSAARAIGRCRPAPSPWTTSSSRCSCDCTAAARSSSCPRLGRTRRRRRRSATSFVGAYASGPAIFKRCCGHGGCCCPQGDGGVLLLLAQSAEVARALAHADRLRRQPLPPRPPRLQVALSRSAGVLRSRRLAPVVWIAASAARYFVTLNAGLGVGFVRLVLGLQRPFWSTEPRSDAPGQLKTSTEFSEYPTRALASEASGGAAESRRNAA